MTPRQLELLTFISRHIESHGFAPTYAEMAEAMGTFSRSSMFAKVDELVAQGYLVHRKNRQRGLERTAKPLPGTGFDLTGLPTTELRAELARRGEL